jgi:glycosidase
VCSSDLYNRRGRTLDFEDPDQLLHGDFPGGLKDLDTSRCDVKDAMVDSYARWIELSDADGFRIDTVKHVEREFWRYFTQKVRQRLAARGKQRFFMFGEAFDGRPGLVGAYTRRDQPSEAQQAREAECVDDGLPLNGDQLDAMFHFPQYYQVFRDVFQLGLSTDRIEKLWQERSLHYGGEAMELGAGVTPIEGMVNFIDNHDVPRFLFHDGDVAALHLALVLLMTEQGIPCLYYGTEQQFDGGNDPANREDLWVSGYATGGETFSWIKSLIALRKEHSALRRGELRVVWASARTGDEPDAGVFAFERDDSGESYALVVMNTHKNKASAPSFQGQPVVIGQAEGSQLVDVLSADRKRYTVGPNGTLAIELAAQTAAILVPAGQAD